MYVKYESINARNISPSVREKPNIKKNSYFQVTRTRPTFNQSKHNTHKCTKWSIAFHEFLRPTDVQSTAKLNCPLTFEWPLTTFKFAQNIALHIKRLCIANIAFIASTIPILGRGPEPTNNKKKINIHKLVL